MRKKTIGLVALSMSVMLSFAACGQSDEGKEVSETTEATEVAEESQVSDEDAAMVVAKLIDAIYVQERTDETDAQCEAAKAAWDALTDEQKELVASASWASAPSPPPRNGAPC